MNWRWLYCGFLIASFVVLLLNLVAGPILAWPSVLLLFVAGGIYFLWCDRGLGAAAFMPVVNYLLVLWVRFAASVIMPQVASLDYSHLGIADAGEEVERAWLTLRLLPLFVLGGYFYLSRPGFKGWLVGLPLAGRSSGWFGRVFSSRNHVNPEERPQKTDKLLELKLRKIGVDPPREDLVVCYSRDGKPVHISNHDRYLHMLVVGPTGAGKTSRILKPMVEQEIKNIRSSLVRGIPRGMTVIEPKGDFASDVFDIAQYYNVPVIYIDPLREDTCKFNPLEGEPTLVAEATRTVLQATFGRQEAFYQKVQELAARNTVLLLKYNRRNDVTMLDMSQMLRDHGKLRREVNELNDLINDIDRKIARAKSEGNRRDLEWLLYLERNRRRIDDLITYFESEVLSEKIGEKIHQFALGLRLQVDDLSGNEYLGRVIGSRSDVNLDAHLNRGGVLVVNTAMGHLGKLGDTFGQFLVMHFQNAVFRRTGNEFTRARHMLVVDEAHRYINPDFERLLAMGRGFRCECILALQNTAQLAIDEKRSFRDSVLNLCRNKVVFGGMDFGEAKFFAGEFGEVKTTKVQKQYGATLLYKQPWKDLKYRETQDVPEQRFDYTGLIELPAFHVVYRLVKDGSAMPPEVGVTRLSEWDSNIKKAQPACVSVGLRVSSEPLSVGVKEPVNAGEDPTDIEV